jgi:hypothetical protein
MCGDGDLLLRDATLRRPRREPPPQVDRSGSVGHHLAKRLEDLRSHLVTRVANRGAQVQVQIGNR